MLPLLMSELAEAIDFRAEILPGVSSPPMPTTSLAMFALVQAILAADAGDRASAANAAASNRVFIKKSSSGKRNQRDAGLRDSHLSGIASRRGREFARSTVRFLGPPPRCRWRCQARMPP